MACMRFLQVPAVLSAVAGLLMAIAEADTRAALPDTRPTSRPAVVYAWFPARFGTWRTDSIRWDLLTHICYRSVELNADGSLREPLGPAAEAALRAFVDTAHGHGVKVTVLVWCANARDSDSYLANAPQNAADSLLAYVKQHNLDGVNIDDETLHERNEVAGKPNRELVTAFFRILAKTFKAANPNYHISFASAAVISGKDRFGTAWPDYAGIAEAVDAIIPMGYTMNPPTIGWTGNPEPLSGGGKAGTTTTRDIQTMVNDYLQAMGGHPEKLLVGVSLDFGGYEWRCRTDRPLSPIVGRGVKRSLAECETAAKAHGRRWDEQQASAWYVYKDGDAFVQGWYNDPQAWEAKLKWIRQQNMGGVGIWVLDGQNDPAERWESLRVLRGSAMTKPQ